MRTPSNPAGRRAAAADEIRALGDNRRPALPAGIVRGILPVLGLALLSLPACTPAEPASIPARTPVRPGQITQVSVIDALMIGRYDGLMPIAELLRYGDFGVGTLDHLDGELIVLDGRAYQARGDGKVVPVDPSRSTPFAVVTPFEPDGESRSIEAGSLQALGGWLDEALRPKNDFLAVRVDGRFASITLRSVPRQEPPYRPLGEVARSQSVWTHRDVSGTLLGIRCPSWVDKLNVPGYHWHFLSDDREIGGHVLDCRVEGGRVRYDVCRDWLIKLDRSAEFRESDLSADHRRDLKRVESSRGEEPKDAPPPR
jgi:acetolactate decarboxylase